MTKTLTEQWREGKLPRGYYYCKLYYNNFEPRIQECVKSRYDSKSCIPMSCGTKDEEVLAPVPSYDEYKELVGKTDKLEKMAFHYTPEEWNTMLRTIDRLQKQLEEANEVIQLHTFMNRSTLDTTTDRFGNECKVFKPSDVYCRKYGLKYGWDYEPKQDYFVRWGVK